MTENRTTSLLQTTTHVLVVGAGLVYLFGFIIVSFSDATYGIVDFSLVRAKVIAVGITFVILVALGMLVTFRTFAIFGLTYDRSELSAVVVAPKNSDLMSVNVALFLPFACYGSTFPLGIWLTGFRILPGKSLGFYGIMCAVIVLLGLASRKWFNAHPYLFVFLAGLNTAAFFIILYKYVSRNTFWFILWLSLVCGLTLQISMKLRNPDDVRKTEWERLFVVIVLVIFGLYAGKVYPNIPHQLGGGAPVPVILHLTKTLPEFDSDSAAVSLIEETEQGYYVVHTSDKALFIARGLVEEVELLRPLPAKQ
jgi:cation transporter-like permease